jgi:tellurite resistance protein
MTPGQRHVYLTWLASDRKSLPPNDGYLFVYFYGLERRALVDETDYGLVFTEVQRLRRMHAAQSQTASRSFQSYTSAFLWYLVAVHGKKLEPEHIETLAQATKSWTEDSLAAALAWFAVRQCPLRPWMAYIVAQESAHSQRSVVIRRLSSDFRRLFTERLRAEFGDGMLLRASKRPRNITYRPASAALQPCSASIVNPFGILSQFRQLSEIWNDCIGELRKLSSIARREGLPAVLTPGTWEAMPPDLRAGVDHPQAPAIYSVVTENTDESGHTFVNVSQLATALAIEQRTKLTAKQSRSVVTTAEYAGFAVEPDVRLTGQNYRWDDLVAVFPQAYEGEPDYQRYGGAACMLRLGVEIAQADGRIDDEELEHVMGQIETGFELNDHERRRLEALRTLLLKIGSDVAGVGQRLQEVLGPSERRSLGRLLVAVAGIDGVITREELAALRRCFRVLKVRPGLLEETLAELAPSAGEEPVQVLPGRPAPPGERIPAPPRGDDRLTLDRARILDIMEETREVSMMLAKAMRVEGEHEESVPAHEAPEARTVPLVDPQRGMPGSEAAGGDAVATTVESEPPPSRYAAFYDELITRARWTCDEADALARGHGHMLAGALEAVNDWAFERLGGPLAYEDGDFIIVERSLLEDSAT